MTNEPELRLFRAPAAEFGEVLRSQPLEDLLRLTPADARASWGRVQAADRPVNLAEAAALLQPAAEPSLEALLARARATTDTIFGRTILLYAPCYLSSYCVNHCRYCAFMFNSPSPRRILTVVEAIREIEILRGWGLRRILLVAAEYPSKMTPAYLAEVLARASERVPELDLEVGPVIEATYRLWAQAGAGGVTCYQETYDTAAYARLHPRGPKSYFDFRLGTLERAAEAGIGRLGLGALMGLADPRRDLLALIAHARFLTARFPEARVTISLPRVRPAVRGFRPDFEVDDASLLRFYAILRLAVPRAGLIGSTREPAALRRRLLMAGITQMSAASATVPGGYAEGESDGGQFQLADHRSVAEVRRDIEELGYAVRAEGPVGAGARR